MIPQSEFARYCVLGAYCGRTLEFFRRTTLVLNLGTNPDTVGFLSPPKRLVLKHLRMEARVGIEHEFVRLQASASST